MYILGHIDGWVVHTSPLAFYQAEVQTQATYSWYYLFLAPR